MLLVVGECPGPGCLPGITAFDGTSGSHLASLVGMTRDSFLEICDTVNIFDRHVPVANWSASEARAQFESVVRQRMRGYQFVLFCGRRVAAAAGCSQQYCTASLGRGILPHPSGCNRWYNDRANKVAARLFLARVILENAPIHRIPTAHSLEEILCRIC